MKNEPEYITHIKERWNFSLTAAKEHLNLANHTATSIAAIIFEKCCSPYHYFVADSMEADSVEV